MLAKIFIPAACLMAFIQTGYFIYFAVAATIAHSREVGFFSIPYDTIISPEIIDNPVGFVIGLVGFFAILFVNAAVCPLYQQRQKGQFDA